MKDLMYLNFLDMIDMYAVLIDKNYNILLANKKMKEKFGEICGRKCHEVFHSLPSPPECCVIQKLLSGEKGEGEFYEPVLDRWWKIKANKVRLNGSTVFLHLTEDITERKVVEEDLKESERRYRQAVENSPNPIFSVDRNGTIQMWNDACRNVFQYGDEIIGKSYQILLPDEDACHLIEAKVERVFRNKESLSGLEITYKCKDGTQRFMVSRLYPLFGRNGSVEGCVFANTDITERKRVEKELKEVNEVLRLFNKMLRHDILNDLTVINGVLEAYKETRDEKLLDIAFKTIEKSIKLVKQMQELESLTGKEEMKPRSLRRIVEEVAEKYSIRYSIEGDCTVMADEALNSVIDNIFRNAVVHGKTDRIDVRIVSDGYCEIRIADYGRGIPDEIKGRIFDEGFVYGESGGTGLGLYIAKKVVERYGGSIEVRNNKPRGAVFVLRLKKCTNSL